MAEGKKNSGPVVKEAADKLSERLNQEITEKMDLWEAYSLRNILRVPQSIQKELETTSDEHFSHSKTEEELKELEQSLDRGNTCIFFILKLVLNGRQTELEDLRKQVVAARYFNAVLTAQVEKGVALQKDKEQLEKVASDLKLNFDFQTNDLTEVKDLISLATDVHSTLSGIRISRGNKADPPLIGELHTHFCFVFGFFGLIATSRRG